MTLRLNLSDNEAKSTAREFSVLPTGTYPCNIVEIKQEEVKPGSLNAGKPYWNVLFVVDGAPDKQYDGRRIYTNLMLFEGAAFLIKQLVEVLFPEMLEGNQLSIPDADAFIGKKVAVVGRKFPAGSSIKRGGKIVGTRDTDEFSVSGFKAADTLVKKTGDTSLLP